MVDIREGNGVFKGLSGDKTKHRKVGILVGFFDCLSSKKMQASILSLVDVEDLYPVSYTVHLPDRDLIFKRRGKLYHGGFSDWINLDGDASKLLLMTMQDKEHLYTKKEVQKARDAKEFLKNAGYPSEREAIHMIRDGNIDNIPVSIEDIKNILTSMESQLR